MNSVFQIINNIQKRCDILEKQWIVTAPSVRLENLKTCAKSVEALIMMCEAEDSLMSLVKDGPSQVAASLPNHPQAHADEMGQMKDKLLQCVKMLAQVGRTSVSHMSGILGISEDKASELLETWKKG